MQNLLTEILWSNEEISEAADRLCQAQPGYDEARQEWGRIAQKVQALIGFPLLDQLQSQILRCTDYEVRAYYALGLGLRESLVRELNL